MSESEHPSPAPFVPTPSPPHIPAVENVARPIGMEPSKIADAADPAPPVAPEKPADAVEAAEAAATKANEAADAARMKAEAARVAAAKAAQDRADAADAARPTWLTVHESTLDKTEMLILKGGYLLRSVWRHLRGGSVPTAGDPLSGSSLTYVPGDAPPIAPIGVMVLKSDDLVSGTDPARATLADVHPITQLATAPEVVLALPGKKMRVLNSRDPATVGTVRDALPSDGVV